MSEEVAQAIGTIDYWRRRAEQAEASAAVLQEALVNCRQMLDNINGRQLLISDARGGHTTLDYDTEITEADAALAGSAGAALLAELAVARDLADAAQAALNAPLFEHRAALEAALAAYRTARRRT